MTKQQFAEFHKYLAMLIYEYNKISINHNVSEKSRQEVSTEKKELFDYDWLNEGE